MGGPGSGRKKGSGGKKPGTFIREANKKRKEHEKFASKIKLKGKQAERPLRFAK